MGSVRYVMQLAPVTDLVEGMLETWYGLLGQVPELISSCNRFSVFKDKSSSTNIWQIAAGLVLYLS